MSKKVVYENQDQPKIDHIAEKTIYPMTVYPGRSVMSSMKSVQSFEKRTQENIPGIHLCDMKMRTFNQVSDVKDGIFGQK